MKRSRRYLTWAIAGFFVSVLASIGAAQGAESKPASRPAIDEAESVQQLLKELEVALVYRRPTPERVAELMQQAGLPPPEPGDENKDALATTWNTVLTNWSEPLLESARAMAAAGDFRAALDGYDRVIDELYRYMAARRHYVTEAFDRHLGGRPNRKLPGLKESIAESDVLVEKLETPEYEASIPQMDVLGAERVAAGWRKSTGVDLAFTEGAAEITGVGIEGKKITGVASLGRFPARPWRDLVIDMSFKIVSGRLQMFLRYWPDHPPHYTIIFDEKSGYELNKLYQVTLRVKGSKIEMTQPDQKPQTDTLTISTSRPGGIGFGLDPGSKVLISSLKLKVLR